MICDNYEDDDDLSMELKRVNVFLYVILLRHCMPHLLLSAVGDIVRHRYVLRRTRTHVCSYSASYTFN